MTREAQIELENQFCHLSIAESERRLRALDSSGASIDRGVVQRVIATLLPEVADYIERKLSIRTRGQGGAYKNYMRTLDPETLAAVACYNFFAAVGMARAGIFNNATSIIRYVGHAAELEIRAERLRMVNPVYANQVRNSTVKQRIRNQAQITLELNKAYNEVGIASENWTADVAVRVGEALVAPLFEMGVFTLAHVGGRRGTVVEINPAYEELISPIIDSTNCKMIFPPMLIPPQPWGEDCKGGYITETFVARAPMLNLRRMPYKYKRWVRERLCSPASTPLRAAMSKAQAVPYYVDTDVLQLVEYCALDGSLGLPKLLAREKPAFPLDDDYRSRELTEAEQTILKDWKGTAREWYIEEGERKKAALTFQAKLREMRRYSSFEQMYLPTFIDHRGRMYFRPTCNPQDIDAVKGVFKFKNGVALGRRGLYWLKVHVANCAGFDKVLFDERAKWTDDNWPAIEAFLADPANGTPPDEATAITFYAAAKDLQRAYESGNPETYVSHVPIAMDATCSGLQHFSALMRDPVGAEYTNLIYNGDTTKADIYKHVATVADKIKCEMTEDPVLMDYWKDKTISRAMAKRPVMTYVYGSTLMSTMEYVVQSMYDEGYGQIKDDDGTVLYTLNRLSACVGKALRVGIANAVPAAVEAMDYIKHLARHCIDSDGKAAPLRWVTPVGMPVVAWVAATSEIRVPLQSLGVCIVLKNTTDEYASKRALAGASPNFIHSLDSSHLMMVINACDFDIMPIHDSFACHAANVDEMHKVLRSTFVELYNNTNLGILFNHNCYSGEPSSPPQVGNFNLNHVINSPFMFC